MSKSTSQHSAVLGQSCRELFPQFLRDFDGRKVSYLDSAASALTPKSVIAAMQKYYEEQSCNIHRGLYQMSEEATTDYESVRQLVADFLNAKKAEEIVFTSGTTDALNLIALGIEGISSKDKILCLGSEHHANIVPWQMLRDRVGCQVDFVQIKKNGEIDENDFQKKLTADVKIVSIGWISNAIGTIHPIQKIIATAKSINALTVVDAAQAVSHLKVDVQAIDCDFLCFSAHKLFGPTGVGVLYGKQDRLKLIKPVRGGGDMIRSVSYEKSTYAEPPFCFEAGTPNISGVIGLGAAIKFISQFDLDEVAAHENMLSQFARQELSKIEGLTIIGQADEQAPVISFVVEGIHAHDLSAILDQKAVAVRAGLHCAEPLIKELGVSATCRASFSIYNDKDDVERLVEAIAYAKEILLS